MPIVKRVLKQLPLILLSPLMALIGAAALFLTDLLYFLFGRTKPPSGTPVDRSAATVVIPNWNGKDLLEKYLPSVVRALEGNPKNEIIVVDDASTDGSVELLRARFPNVRTLALPKNLGFGGASTAGFRAASNDVVVLLNSDMRVAPDFLPPLLEAFEDEKVFAAACQIFFSDPEKKREETGLTQGWWSQGALRVRHIIDEEIEQPFPCFYAGGGSSAFDRRKFLELGGFDPALKPFYAEDTDLGYMAWKRGWKVLYQPASHVWHEHRGTIGKNFRPAWVEDVIRTNFLIFSWKNIHHPGMFCSHIFHTWAGSLVSVAGGDSLERANLRSFARALLRLPGAISARWRARSLACIDDREAFRRPLGGYYRDRFQAVDRNPARLSVVFLSPYPVCPPSHGGAVFMHQTLRRLGEQADVHLIALIDEPWEEQAHEELRPYLRSMRFLLRLEGQPKGVGALEPFAVREFRNLDLEWLIHRQLLVHRAQVFQIEYTNMGQYAPEFRQIPVMLFEHDVYFQSIARQLPALAPWKRFKAGLEYLRALHYELRLLPRIDRIQTCTPENTKLLTSFLPELAPKIDSHLRAGIDVSRYEFSSGGRLPKTMLFLGSFRHAPNDAGVRWFLRDVMPLILQREPEARLTVIGSDPPAAHTVPTYGGAVELRGFVEDLTQPMREHAVFICPILAGSGLRVKLLEAFASGIPVVSTRVGAEGLGEEDGLYCRLANSPREFADAVLAVISNPEEAERMAARAREYVSRERDMAPMTRQLELTYRKALSSKGS